MKDIQSIQNRYAHTEWTGTVWQTKSHQWFPTGIRQNRHQRWNRITRRLWVRYWRNRQPIWGTST